jgi:hypothetical protein
VNHLAREEGGGVKIRNSGEVLLHDLSDHGPETAIGSGEALFVDLFETP